MSLAYGELLSSCFSRVAGASGKHLIDNSHRILFPKLKYFPLRPEQVGTTTRKRRASYVI